MAQQANHALPGGHQLEEYTIDRQLSLGGFSIVYLANDPSGRQVAIKEYCRTASRFAPKERSSRSSRRIIWAPSATG